jgi:membrane protease YdiL (CAAX protease family)
MLDFIRRLFLKTVQDAESESVVYMHESYEKPNLRVMLVCVLVAFSLVMIHYFSEIDFVLGFLKSLGAVHIAGSFESLMYASSNAQLWRLGWWAFLIILFYFVVPVFVILFVFKEKLSDYGIRFQGAFKDIKLYFIMLCVMIPLVLFFSTTRSFQARYPFYELRSGQAMFPNFLIWECLYFLQFFSLEFFFRGFIVHGLKKRFGFYSVFVMTIPYCMIHFGKPFPETLAAIIAGVVLGTLSLKSRSILLGVLIHFSVAIAMDLCSLWQKGLL